MAILNFPTDVSTGTQITGDNGVTYIFDGIKWVGHSPKSAPGTNSIINNGKVNTV